MNVWWERLIAHLVAAPPDGHAMTAEEARNVPSEQALTAMHRELHPDGANLGHSHKWADQ